MERWIEEMEALSQYDEHVRQAQHRLEALQPQFYYIRNRLSPEDRLTLDRYIAACQEREYACVYVAYQVGQKHTPWSCK